jgi:hypothetical protein
MRYAYEDLSDTQFENVVIFLCGYLLGVSVQGFSKGPDGGRDARFTGTAELHPSKAAPWKGTTIIQAKHTNGYNCTFMDSEFFSPKSKNTTLGEELPRIKKLRASKELDHYMLFSNRRLAGNADSTIRLHISKECDIVAPSIYLCGVEQLERWLKTFPEVPKRAQIDPIDSPLIVSSEELAEVVEAIANHRQEVTATLNHPPTPRIAYEKKNSTNNMSAEYAKRQRSAL